MKTKDKKVVAVIYRGELERMLREMGSEALEIFDFTIIGVTDTAIQIDCAGKKRVTKKDW